MHYLLMQVKQISVYLFLIVFSIQVLAFSSLSTGSSVTNTSQSTQLNNITLIDPHSFDTNVILLNYVNNQSFTNGILNKLPTTIPVKDGIQTITYHMNYHFIFPDNNFTDSFNNYISSISTPNSPTVDINQTALAYQAVNNTVQNIFINNTGTAIDGIALENWLWTQGQQFIKDNASYQIFL